ncbi:unnamed protein product [Lupinus luteus]|uniref:Uncharacterized protein n=1 Tax=Lupinus luteus TaxID=3873 RepID=A0AAV1Y4Z3_LUPLU
MVPTEKKEQGALYSTIQGYVGDWWNAYELCLDPCGLTPIGIGGLLKNVTMEDIVGLRVCDHSLLSSTL